MRKLVARGELCSIHPRTKLEIDDEQYMCAIDYWIKNEKPKSFDNTDSLFEK